MFHTVLFFCYLELPASLYLILPVLNPSKKSNPFQETKECWACVSLVQWRHKSALETFIMLSLFMHKYYIPFCTKKKINWIGSSEAQQLIVGFRENLVPVVFYLCVFVHYPLQIYWIYGGEDILEYFEPFPGLSMPLGLASLIRRTQLTSLMLEWATHYC